MSQRDGFGSGFLLGTIMGGLVGALVATVVTQRANESLEAEPQPNTTLSDAKNNTRGKRSQMKAASSEVTIEAARRSLEDKIAQLNATIDEVRLTLGNVNGRTPDRENIETPLEREP